MKYIDVERLRARIEKNLAFDNSIDTAYYKGRRDAERNILDLIDSLQQEQTEVDLEKDIDAWWQNWLSPSNQKEVEGVLPKTEFAMYARYFFELGQSTKYQQDREEFAKLKAREWINGYDEGYAKGLNARKEEKRCLNK